MELSDEDFLLQLDGSLEAQDEGPPQDEAQDEKLLSSDVIEDFGLGLDQDLHLQHQEEQQEQHQEGQPQQEEHKQEDFFIDEDVE